MVAIAPTLEVTFWVSLSVCIVETPSAEGGTRLLASPPRRPWRRAECPGFRGAAGCRSGAHRREPADSNPARTRTALREVPNPGRLHGDWVIIRFRLPGICAPCGCVSASPRARDYAWPELPWPISSSTLYKPAGVKSMPPSSWPSSEPAPSSAKASSSNGQPTSPRPSSRTNHPEQRMSPKNTGAGLLTDPALPKSLKCR
jgi:hypothetical protein